MPPLPSAGSGNTVGVLLSIKADDGAVKTVQAELTGLGNTAKGVGATAKSSFDQFTSSLKSVGQQATDVGRSLTAGITLPVVGVGVAAVKAASDFQTQMML